LLDRSGSSGLAFRSAFLEKLIPSERDWVIALSARLAEALYPWAAQYTDIRVRRVRPLALSVAAAAPFSDLEALVATAQVSLWVFALDDRFDESKQSRSDLEHDAARFHAIAGNQLYPEPGDSLEAALADVCRGLRRFPLFESLGTIWIKALQGTIAGMLQESAWNEDYRRRGWAALPPYPAYLANGRYSIGGPPHVWAAVITSNDVSAPENLGILRPMEEIASCCVRLANDLQSEAKEVVEGKFNAIALLSQPFKSRAVPDDVARELARTAIREQIAHGQVELARYRAAARTRTGHPEAAIDDIARFVCEFYADYDYHTFDRVVVAGTETIVEGARRQRET
jgi:hypothetical protein